MRIRCKDHLDVVPDTIITDLRDGCMINIFCSACDNILWGCVSNVIFRTAVTEHGVIDP